MLKIIKIRTQEFVTNAPIRTFVIKWYISWTQIWASNSSFQKSVSILISKFISCDYWKFSNKSKCFGNDLKHLRTWKDRQAASATGFKPYSSMCGRRLKHFVLAWNEDILHNMACSEPALATTKSVCCICAGGLVNISQIYDFNIFDSRMDCFLSQKLGASFWNGNLWLNVWLQNLYHTIMKNFLKWNWNNHDGYLFYVGC